MSWKTVFEDGFEGEEHDQGAPELTLPVGYNVYWMENDRFERLLNRPEMDLKRKANGQPEVFMGWKSAGGAFTFCTGRLYFVSIPIPIVTARPTYAQIYHMHIFTGGHGGARLGICDGSGEFAADFERDAFNDNDPQADPAITWGPWRSTYLEDSGFLGNGSWACLVTPEIIPQHSFVRTVVQFNSNNAAPHAAAHWDVLTVWQDIDDDPPPSTPIDYERIRQIVRTELEDVLNSLVIQIGT